jgi:hypothetical protein
VIIISKSKFKVNAAARRPDKYYCRMPLCGTCYFTVRHV